MFVHCLTCGSECVKGADTGLGLVVCVRVRQGPGPFYMLAPSEGITDTETKSLSSQPPQNRNTPIIKERENQRGRESGCRQREYSLRGEIR